MIMVDNDDYGRQFLFSFYFDIEKGSVECWGHRVNSNDANVYDGKVYSTEVFCFEGKEGGCYKVQETDPTFF